MVLPGLFSSPLSRCAVIHSPRRYEPSSVLGMPATIMVQKYLRPAAIKAGVLKADDRVRFGFHNFRHSLASALVKLKCDPKTVQGILRHEDVRTTMQLYVQSDQESKLEAQGKFLELLLGDKAHLLTETIQ
jgi:integrase